MQRGAAAGNHFHSSGIRNRFRSPVLAVAIGVISGSEAFMRCPVWVNLHQAGGEWWGGPGCKEEKPRTRPTWEQGGFSSACDLIFSFVVPLRCEVTPCNAGQNHSLVGKRVR